ncbi:MAG TPA: hypothetical protein VFI69_01390 [Candidatus Limnocylindrales bacterium]|jgi:hypothetical protein|nr:hypothetical protein [Candidatus Limnocylindrales bacterium]
MFEPVARALRLLRLSAARGTTVDPGDGGATARLFPAVDFVAYAEDCILSGRVRLAAERLTDMLDDHDEILMHDVLAEPLDGSGAVEVSELLVRRDEIVFAHGTGPRGSVARRRRTRQHPLAIGLGRFDVHGYVHALPGSDPLTAIRRRRSMVPLTDAWIEYQVGTERQRRRVGAVLLNRDHIDTVASGREHEVDMPDLPVSTEQGPLLKDFTGHILGDA